MSTKSERKVIQSIIASYRAPEEFTKKMESRRQWLSILSVLTLLYPMSAMLFDFGPRWTIVVIAFIAGLVNNTVANTRLFLKLRPLHLKYTTLKEDVIAEFENQSES